MSFLDQLFIEKETFVTDEGFTAVVQSNPDHPVYQSHFPGNPITPGACLLKTAGTLLQRNIGRPLFLKSSKNIKYLSILIPEAGKEVKFSFSHVVESETECKAQVVIADENVVYTKMSLVLSYEQV